MYKRIEFFKWEKEGKRKYQINVERIFESYKCAEDVLKNLEKNLVGLDIKNKKEVNKFKEKSNQILFDIDAFMYWTYYLNLNQKNNILENNNILYNKKILYIRNLNNKFCQVKVKKLKKSKEQEEKEKYDNILKKYNNKINELIYKINLEKENNKKLKLIINLEYIFYEIQKEMISKKINLDYNPFYFNCHYMKKIIKEIKRYNDKFYKKAKIDKENIEKNFIPKKINIKKYLSI